MNRRDLYSSSNFTKDSLPKTRKEVFKFVTKLHYFSLLKMGLILLAFSIPLFVIHFFKDYSFIVANETGNSNFLIYIVCSILEIFATMILAIPIAGFGKVIREYCWLEPVFFKDDFKQGIKDNIKPTLISAFLIGLLQFAFDFIRYYNISGWILAIPFGGLAVVFFPILMHTIYLNFIYTNKYWVNLKLGCYLYLKHLPTTILFTVLIALFKVYDLFWFSNVFAILTKYFVFILIILFILPMLFIATQLNELRIFDKEINISRFPNLINKGLNVTENSDK